MSDVTDRWAAASTYERFMGRWSRELAREFVQWIEAPAGGHWLDVGCGTGSLTTAICAHADPASVTACDPAAAFIEYARTQVDDDRVSFLVGGADDFPLCPGGYDAISSLLALNFFPEPAAALSRMVSALSRHGTVSACVWDYAGRMEFLRYFWNCAVELDVGARDHDEGVRFPICDPDRLADLFRGAGLVDIRCDPIEIATEFASFDDYWQPFLGGTGPAPSFVATLRDADRTLLEHSLQSTLPVGSNGRIALRASAWAVRGVAG